MDSTQTYINLRRNQQKVNKQNALLKAISDLLNECDCSNTLVSVQEEEVFSGLPGLQIQSLEDFVEDEINENVNISEQDDEEMLGISSKEPSEEEIQDYLDRVMKGQKTEKEKYIMPYVHNKVLVQIQGPSVVLNKEGTGAMNAETGKKVDVEALKKTLTQRPPQILSQNQKMQKSGGETYQFFNFGIPALKGLAVNEKTNKFAVVNTCPGAGACQRFCYALKGGYIQYPASFMKQTRMLNYLLNDPKGFFDQLKNEIAKQKSKFDKKKVKLVIRWHDAGDFFSESYRTMFFDVVKAFPDIIFYSYTKVAQNVLADAPDNFVINFSQGAKRKEEVKVDTKNIKHSAVVEKSLFTDLVQRVEKTDEKGKVIKSWAFKSDQDLNTFKTRLADKYDLDTNSILSYEEMLDTPLSSEKGKYNVIVLPGQGDESASRSDVLGTYLLIH